MAKFLQITPCMQVADVEAAVRFFVEVLGFTSTIQGPTYAYLERGAAGMRILQASTATGEEQPPGTRAFRYYIDVEGLDDLYAELKPKLDALPGGQVFGPVAQRYGQRELMILAPDGDLVVFGEEMPGSRGGREG